MSDPQGSAQIREGGASEHQPLVTIVVPAYNRAGGLLEETLDSILGQDYPNLEVLALDDGSTDQTPEVSSATRPLTRTGWYGSATRTWARRGP